MEIIYCKKWWFPRKKPIEIFNEETARNNHLSGEDYTVVLKQNDMVSYVVEMAKNDVFVHFMNDNEVNYITYAFHKENDKLFKCKYHELGGKEIELMVLVLNKMVSCIWKEGFAKRRNRRESSS